MKTYFISLLLFITSISLALTGGPKISAPEASFDFGEIVEGELVTHNFVITNEGDENLIISKVRASCGCTAAKPEKNELAPGESTSINVQFNSTHRSGLQKKHVYVFSNDPVNQQFRFTFTTKILARSEKPPEASSEAEKMSEGKS